MAAIIATARQGSTLSDAVWYSAAVIACISLDTQIRPTYNQTMTPYEAFEGHPPNLEKIFKFRLGQIVTVTQLTDKRNKTDHNLAGVTCYALHPDITSRDASGTWVYCPHPDVQRAYQRSNIDIQEVQFEEIDNQSIMSFQPTYNTHPTYPAEDIAKFIDGKANMQQDEPTVKQPAKDRVHRDPYIDCNVRKKFGRKYYMGTVDHAWFGKNSEIYYHVIYEDKEVEDLTEEDLQKIVIKEPQQSPLIEPAMQVNSTERPHADADIAEYYGNNNSEKAQQYPRLVHDYEYYYEDAYDSTTAYMVNSTAAQGQKQMREEPIHRAYKTDREKWDSIVRKLMHTHLVEIGSIVLVEASDIPAGAKIFPSTIMCKAGKVDTSRQGEHKVDAVRLVVQDTRSIHTPAEVFSSVANSKAIKAFLSIVARNGLKDYMRHVDVWKAFPNTQLPPELQGTLFIKLPKELGYPVDVYARLVHALEGMRPSNHIYDRHINKGLVANGFQGVPNDDQVIFKVEEDGNFLLAVKVVDNILSVATRQPLQQQLASAIEESGYQLKDEATDKFVGLQLEWSDEGDLLVHQERHEGKLVKKYDIKKTAVTTLPSNFTQTNYLTSGESEAVDIRDYQQLTGDLIYLQLTNSAIPYAISAVSQKTQHCTKRDYEAALHILQYINGHRKQGLIFRRAPVAQRPHSLTDILHIPISINFCCDGAHNAVTTFDDPKDQSGYFIKLYSWLVYRSG
jgi:hypothetical protein